MSTRPTLRRNKPYTTGKTAAGRPSALHTAPIASVDGKRVTRLVGMSRKRIAQGERREKNPTATPTEKFCLTTPMPL